MQVKNIDTRFTLAGDCEVIITVPKGERDNITNLIDDFKKKLDKVWVANIAIKRKKRSLDANAYCFVLCDKLAEKLGTTKEIVYQKAIREVGAFDILLLQNQAVESFLNM